MGKGGHCSDEGDTLSIYEQSVALHCLVIDMLPLLMLWLSDSHRMKSRWGRVNALLQAESFACQLKCKVIHICSLNTGLWHTQDAQPSLVFSMHASLDIADASFHPNLQSQCTPHSSAEGGVTAVLLGSYSSVKPLKTVHNARDRKQLA